MILIIYIFNFFNSLYICNVIKENAQLVELYIKKNNGESLIESMNVKDVLKIQPNVLN